MSYRIEYQWIALSITSEHAPGLRGPRFVIAIEGGDNNLTEMGPHGKARRARRWEIGMIGTKSQVLRQATRYSASCEGRELKPGGRSCSPEQYISRIRRVMAQAWTPERSLCHLGLGAELPVDHPVVQAPEMDGFTYYRGSYLGREFVKLIPNDLHRWAAFFEALHPYLDDLSLAPFRLGQVQGLPAS